MWKQLLIIVIAGISVLMIAGCNNKVKETNKSVDKKTTEINVAKKTTDFSITLTKAKIVDNELNTDPNHVTLELSVEAENISKEDVGIGSGDITIRNENGETFKFTGNENNFGDVVEPGKTLKGKGYYSIPENSKNLVVIYKPYKSTEQLKWSIGTPKKEK